MATRSVRMAVAEESGSIDLGAVYAHRLARTRDRLREHGLAAALLFDPLNVRYATSIAVPGYLILNLHMSWRWVLVPVESPPVVWEYSGAVDIGREQFAGDIRPAP